MKVYNKGTNDLHESVHFSECSTNNKRAEPIPVQNQWHQDTTLHERLKVLKLLERETTATMKKTKLKPEKFGQNFQVFCDYNTSTTEFQMYMLCK
jgi:hypothetical protein